MKNPISPKPKRAPHRLTIPIKMASEFLPNEEPFLVRKVQFFSEQRARINVEHNSLMLTPINIQVPFSIVYYSPPVWH
jgi:hypothetical protein